MTEKPIDAVIFVARDQGLADVIATVTDVLEIPCWRAETAAHAAKAQAQDHPNACCILPAQDATAAFSSCRQLIVCLAQGESGHNLLALPHADVLAAPWTVAELSFLLRRGLHRDESDT